MSAWDKYDYWRRAFMTSAPMMLVAAWSTSNARSWTNDLMEPLTPEGLAAATGGLMSKEAIATYIVESNRTDLIKEVLGDLDESRTADQFLQWVSPDDLVENLVGAFKDHVLETRWWLKNSAEFRRACSRHKAVSKVLGS